MLLSGPRPSELAEVFISSDVAQGLLQAEMKLCIAQLSLWHLDLEAAEKEVDRCEDQVQQVRA